jgi:hypothetical protein
MVSSIRPRFEFVTSFLDRVVSRARVVGSGVLVIVYEPDL